MPQDQKWTTTKEMKVTEFYYFYTFIKEMLPLVKVFELKDSDMDAMAKDDLMANLAGDQQEECSICLTNKNEVALPGCGHAFCRVCLKEWGSKSQSCPMCVEEKIREQS